MKLPKGLNSLLTAWYLRRKGVEWSGVLPEINMRRPPQFWVEGRLVLGSGVKIFTPIGGRTLFQVGPGAIITIGEHTVLNSVDWIHCAQEIAIGAETLLAPGVKIIDSNMHDKWPWEKDVALPVRLGKRCWIGMDCKILRGVQIGEYSIVGAGSVVTKDVPPGTEAGGNPARAFKHIDPEHIKKLEETNWSRI